MTWFKKHIANNAKTFIVAEAGINHNGDFKMALELVLTAKDAGADCIKFQTFRTTSSESKNSFMPNYFSGHIGHLDKQAWSKSLEFSLEEFRQLKNYCEEVGIAFLSTACDVEGFNILKEIGIECIKIASADVNNDMLLTCFKGETKSIILSTGMSTDEEITHAINFLKKECNISEIALLQCTSQYPAPYNQIDLNVIRTMQEKYSLPVGFSDHTEGIHIPMAAVALGAKIIEKHFTLDRALPGVDHAASIEPKEFALMVRQIRDIEKAVGNFHKKIHDSELINAQSMRKSLMASKPIRAGSIISYDDIVTKRPGTGIPPSQIDKIVGKKVLVDLSFEDFFQYHMFE
ncbi:MAG: N-acetylneuraminate synthase family protein [Oligoflexia bacterium]|nr:N-acetylneuraminate synthase family protein [Oligoflexia bacterium]